MANILVVDDAAFVRYTMKGILEKNGHTVVADTDSGSLALQLYEKHKPDIVLLDITMPGMNGIEILTKLRAMDSKAKVIMCSSMGQPAMLAETIERGALDFVIKPFKEEQVITAIEKALKK